MVTTPVLPEELVVQLGARIKALRLLAGWKRATLAERRYFRFLAEAVLTGGHRENGGLPHSVFSVASCSKTLKTLVRFSRQHLPWRTWRPAVSLPNGLAVGQIVKLQEKTMVG